MRVLVDGSECKGLVGTTDAVKTAGPGVSELLLIVADRERAAIRPPERGSGLEEFTNDTALCECCRVLIALRLVVEEIEPGPEPRTWLVITERGKRVAELLLKIRFVLKP